MASVFQDAVATALANQSWFARRKDSLAATAGTILQVVNLATAYMTGAPYWVTVLVAVVVGIAQIVVHAGTKGAITPSMATRLELAGMRANMDRVSISGVKAVPKQEDSTVSQVSLPVYDADSSRPQGG
ncbi:hypothetical protein ACFLIN_03700 [Corynebacterium kutscheri]|uniref:hypothetical protein n=1 Tax=Corynebacterium kutscheri TaxID=35755 RepID=UPI0037BEB188